MFPIVFIGTGFPSAPARVDCLTRPDFLLGCCCWWVTFSGVFLLFTLFGYGSMFSDVDDHELLDEIVVALFNFPTGIPSLLLASVVPAFPLFFFL